MAPSVHVNYTVPFQMIPKMNSKGFGLVWEFNDPVNNWQFTCSEKLVDIDLDVLILVC